MEKPVSKTKSQEAIMNIQEAISIVAQASALASLQKQGHIQVDQALKTIMSYVEEKEKPTSGETEEVKKEKK